MKQDIIRRRNFAIYLGNTSNLREQFNKEADAKGEIWQLALHEYFLLLAEEIEEQLAKKGLSLTDALEVIDSLQESRIIYKMELNQ